MTRGGSVVRNTLTPPYVLPGTVGYLGALGALTSYSPVGSGLPGAGNAPSGWSWTAAGLRNDSSPVSLDHAYVYGGLYTAGNVITVTNCIIQAGTGSEIACIQHHGAAATSGGVLTVYDSTMNWLSTVPPGSVAGGSDIAPIFDVAGPRYDIRRCDLSGTPQGLDPSGSDLGATNPSLVLDNWIHNLIQNNPGGPNHLDGLFSQGGSNLIVTGNYINIFAESTPGASDVTAAIFFHDATQTDTDVTVQGNFLNGGGNTFYNETVVGIVVTDNVFGGLCLFGDALNQAGPGGTIGKWARNRHLDGTTVASP